VTGRQLVLRTRTVTLGQTVLAAQVRRTFGVTEFSVAQPKRFESAGHQNRTKNLRIAKLGNLADSEICKMPKFSDSKDSDSDISGRNENQSRALVFPQRKNLRIICFVDVGAPVA
jgi:hypothetical protein